MITCRFRDPVTSVYRSSVPAEVLAKSDSIIGFTYVLENVEERWVALAIRLRADDTDLTCSKVVRYGPGQAALYRPQAISILKGDA